MYLITVYKDAAGYWRWSLSYRNNIIAVSTIGYSTPWNAKRSFRSVARNIRKYDYNVEVVK